MVEVVDTCIWSESLRRTSGDSQTVARLAHLTLHDDAILIGSVRQETLSGLRSIPEYQRLKRLLRAVADEAASADDHEVAAEYSNRCRSRGVQGSNTDFLICAVSIRLAAPIFTVDQDFQRFKLHLPIRVTGPADPV